MSQGTLIVFRSMTTEQREEYAAGMLSREELDEVVSCARIQEETAFQSASTEQVLKERISRLSAAVTAGKRVASIDLDVSSARFRDLLAEQAETRHFSLLCVSPCYRQNPEGGVTVTIEIHGVRSKNRIRKLNNFWR